MLPVQVAYGSFIVLFAVYFLTALLDALIPFSSFTFFIDQSISLISGYFFVRYFKNVRFALVGGFLTSLYLSTFYIFSTGRFGYASDFFVWFALGVLLYFKLPNGTNMRSVSKYIALWLGLSSLYFIELRETAFSDDFFPVLIFDYLLFGPLHFAILISDHFDFFEEMYVGLYLYVILWFFFSPMLKKWRWLLYVAHIGFGILTLFILAASAGH